MKPLNLPPQVRTQYDVLQRIATGKVRDAICRGLLPRVCTKYRSDFEHIDTIPCVDCGNPAFVYDHRDYLTPLAVEPVCQGCNYHRGMAVATFADHPEYWLEFDRGNEQRRHYRPTNRYSDDASTSEVKPSAKNLKTARQNRWPTKP